MTQTIYIVQAEHPTVPGRPMKAFSSKDSAVAEAISLLALMPGKPVATPENWEQVLETLQDEHGARDCDVWITELQLQP